MQFIKNIEDGLADPIPFPGGQAEQPGFLAGALLPDQVPDGRIAEAQPSQVGVLPAEGIPPSQQILPAVHQVQPALLILS